MRADLLQIWNNRKIQPTTGDLINENTVLLKPEPSSMQPKLPQKNYETKTWLDVFFIYSS